MPFLVLSPVSAQPPLPPPPTEPPTTDTYLDFDFYPTTATFQYVALVGTVQGPTGIIGDLARFDFYIRDYSIDPSSPYAATKPSQEHQTTFRIEWLNTTTPDANKWDGDPEWTIQDQMQGAAITYSGGVSETQTVILTHTVNVHEPAAAIRVIANMSLVAEPTTFVEQAIEFYARILPAPAIQVQILYDGDQLLAGKPGAPLNAPPDTWVSVPIIVQNSDLYIQHINVGLHEFQGDGVDPAQVPVRGAVGVVLDPFSQEIVHLSFKTPKQKTYYGSASISYAVRAYNVNNPEVVQSTTGVVSISGFYISTPMQVVIVLLIILLILFILIIVRGKRYYEENILGKPIPPWRIPEEAAALDRQRKADPRTFYITRYFLMVEEYESALNWFHEYKRRTKKGLKREARSSQLADRAALLKNPETDRFDDRSERIKRRMRRKQERRRLQYEAEIAKLQEKLEQHYEEDFEKDHEKWEKKVEKLKAKANRPWAKARKQWEREVARELAAWEKPFAKDKAKREKEIEKAKEKYAKVVKKKDKETWLAWTEAVEANEQENKIRAKEGREALPEPALFSEAAGAPEIPKPFKAPPKPKLPPEPAEPVVKDLPPEPTMALPKLEDSHYARKARRERKKTDRKVRRLERKLERMLAKNERDRVKFIAKSSKKREKLLRKSHRVTQPTLMEQLFRNTPEDRERRAHKKLLKALARERVKALKESEDARLEVLTVEAQRREAELLAKLVRQQAEVRKTGASPAMRVEEEPELITLRDSNQAKIARETAAAEKRVEDERKRAADELQKQLTEQLVKERSERERLQQQRAASIQAKQEAKKAAREDEVKDDAEPPAEEPPKGKKAAPAKRGKK